MIVEYPEYNLKLEVLFLRNDDLHKKNLKVSIYERKLFFFWKHAVTWNFTVDHFRPADTRRFVDNVVKDFRVLKYNILT